MKKNTTKKMIDKSDMFQSRLVKIDEFGWLDSEFVSEDVDT